MVLETIMALEVQSQGPGRFSDSVTGECFLPGSQKAVFSLYSHMVGGVRELSGASLSFFFFSLLETQCSRV